MIDYSCKHIIWHLPSIIGDSSYQGYKSGILYGVGSNQPFDHQSIIPSLGPIDSHFIDQALQAIIHLLRGLIIKHYKPIKLPLKHLNHWPSTWAWYLYETLGVFPTSH
jgi:hypothetical protein